MRNVVLSMSLLATIVFANPLNENVEVNGKIFNPNQLVGQLKMLTTTNPYVKNANFMLGLYYFSGDPSQGIEPDYKKALEHMKKDIDNLSIANYKIGEIYYYGLDTKQDLFSAIQWFERSIKKEYMDSKQVAPLANAAIGAIYLNEMKDAKKAFPYLLKAAQDGTVVQAQMAIAFMYAKGDGIKQNWDEADYWLNKAWKNPNVTDEQKAYLNNSIEKVTNGYDCETCSSAK